ncbi:hypothetical protein H012_gp326 [Acanthamoeba polyphaga moumouvirus]|uniref:Uncharacterized protein n=1 Tax=Acanthamoeba polyphaga moumouvirus TaxID=1269028 RepID=L7RC64_9VIRU|nr:hypothetical protein H012_gp326 [Acanthamoeba polyphaga moumouvirus]AGC02129.1 hypothetical protein Moumou_00603 [Acanthamoeba polyphaga moumouvirus]
MEELRIIFIDTMLLFLSCIVEIFSYLKNKFKGIILPKKNIIETKKILEETNNYPGIGYTCGTFNLINPKEIDKETILRARLSKFDQYTNSENQRIAKQNKIKEIIQNKYKKQQLHEQKYCLYDKKNEQILKDWIN